jgi:hypothetical protein
MNVPEEVIKAALILIAVVEANGLNSVASAQAYIDFRTLVIGARLQHVVSAHFDGSVSAH